MSRQAPRSKSRGPRSEVPDGTKVAVWLVLNLEDWLLESPARRILPPPGGAPTEIDVPNYSWHEYGLRAGFWRMKPLFDKYGLAPTVALNASVCEEYPAVAEVCRRSGWEIMGHGFKQRALTSVADEAEEIGSTKRRITSYFGRSPKGWLSPGLAETKDTLRILVQEGFEYVCDWVNDDRPYPINLPGGTIYSIPYTVELNDITIFALQHHPAEEFYNRVRAQLSALLREGEKTPKVMAIAVHPYLSGVPHRVRTLERILRLVTRESGVWVTSGSEIVRAFKDGGPISRNA